MPESLLPKNYHVFVAALTAQFGLFLSGTYYSWSSPTLVKLASLEDNPIGRTITSTEQVWIVTIGVFGLWIGSSCSGKLSRSFGRRPAMILMMLPLLISFIILTFLKQIGLMFFARILGGITNGGMTTLVPIYFGEIADPKNRGRLGAAFNLFLNGGLLFSLCIGPYTTYRVFNLILMFCVLIYTILLIVIISESPYYLVEKDINKAEETLKKLRGVDDVKQELKQIQQYLEKEPSEIGSFSEIIFNKTYSKSLIIGIGVCCFQQCSGITIIMGFGQTIFEGVEGFLPSYISIIILGISQVAFGLVAPFFTSHFGRRTLLISSYTGIAMSLFTFGLYFVLKKYELSLDGISWLPLSSMIVFMFAFGIGAGAVTYIVVGEIFPSKTKGLATSVSNILASITGVLVINSFKIIEQQIGIGYAIWALGFLSSIAAVFSAYFIVETKGKTLKEIQDIMNKKEPNEIEIIEL